MVQNAGSSPHPITHTLQQPPPPILNVSPLCPPLSRLSELQIKRLAAAYATRPTMAGAAARLVVVVMVMVIVLVVVVVEGVVLVMSSSSFWSC